MSLRTRIIHWLGGFDYGDFTPIEQATILQMQAWRAVETELANRFLSDIGKPDKMFIEGPPQKATHASFTTEEEAGLKIPKADV